MRRQRKESGPSPWFLSDRSTSLRAPVAQAWSSLAWSLLEHSENLCPPLVGANGPRFGLPWLQVWDDPAGVSCEQEPCTLTLFHPFCSTDRPLVRKAIWQRTADLRRLWEPAGERDMPKHFNPVITITDAQLPAEEIEAVLDSVGNIRLPLVGGRRQSVSVTSDVGEWASPFLRWTSSPRLTSGLPGQGPPEWQPAIAFATRLRSFLESSLDWQNLVSTWGVCAAEGSRTFGQIVKTYSGPGRFYHTLDHVQDVLETVRVLGSHARNFGAVKLAGWLHDVIYDSRSSDNEERSAGFAERLCAELSIPDGPRVAALILRTKTHDAGSDVDAQVLIDADLAIHGASEQAYRIYADRIRQEYAWVPVPQDRDGRRHVLEHFLTKHSIYHFLGHLEEPARHNLAAEIARLDAV